MAERKKFYITTPIYYPSGKWHVGTCYTTLVCDAIARFKRMDGFDVFYLTGTDEHGKKIAAAAEKAGKSPKAFVDEIVDSLKQLWALYEISYDKFIRTTDEEHKKIVQKIFTKLKENGDIYKGEYEGWYCVPCEAYWTQSQLKEGKCPDCGREVEKTKESSYFFRLSKYQKLAEELLSREDFLLPASRRNEMLNNFVKPGLTDLSISRTSFEWGIPVPQDEKHVLYVWIDALANYLTALGYLSDDDENFRKYWPCDVHFMAKEIVRFHSILWPAMLTSLSLPLPKKIYAHGWFMFGDEKMSKSKGNVIDPFLLAERYGVDAMRYALIAQGPFAQDAGYSQENLIYQINADLANDLGNLLSRTSAMAVQYANGILPQKAESEAKEDKELAAMCEALLDNMRKAIDAPDVPSAMDEVMKLVRRANKYVDETMPWTLKKQGEQERLNTVLYHLCETLRFAAIALQPFMPATTPLILQQLGVEDETLKTFDSLKVFGRFKSTGVRKGENLFNRIDVKKEMEELKALAASAEKAEKKEKEMSKQESDTAVKSEIAIEDFDKLQLVVAEVKAAEKVEKADKLLKLTLFDGQKERTVVSGIAKYYTPEQMVGKKVVVIANLKPVKLRGILSEGMVLCASDDEGNLCLVSPENAIKSGSGVF